jgi:hypothetical protein
MYKKPSYWDVHEKKSLNPLEKFVIDNEPAGLTDEAAFEHGMNEMLIFVQKNALAKLQRCRAALREIDKIAVNHTKGGLGLAQKVARAALQESK